jgi:hypothetical protein
MAVKKDVRPMDEAASGLMGDLRLKVWKAREFTTSLASRINPRTPGTGSLT